MQNDIDSTVEALEARRADDEAAAIAAERIHSGAAEHKEDGAEALPRKVNHQPLGLRDAALVR